MTFAELYLADLKSDLIRQSTHLLVHDLRRDGIVCSLQSNTTPARIRDRTSGFVEQGKGHQNVLQGKARGQARSDCGDVFGSLARSSPFSAAAVTSILPASPSYPETAQLAPAPTKRRPLQFGPEHSLPEPPAAMRVGKCL